MKIKLDVDLRPAGTGPVAKEKPVVDPEVRADELRRDREERMLRRIALARVIEARIAAGDFADLADTARRCGVSGARVSQLLY
ncbi:MAG: hypothetical protein R3D98_06475 [Candidatus Krumholzibacteriia bacterium]